MNKLKLAIRGEEPREFRGKTSYWELTESEREEFVENRIEAIKESDIPEAAKQAAMLRGAMSSGLSTAAAFERYVNRNPDWFA